MQQERNRWAACKSAECRVAEDEPIKILVDHIIMWCQSSITGISHSYTTHWLLYNSSLQSDAKNFQKKNKSNGLYNAVQFLYMPRVSTTMQFLDAHRWTNSGKNLGSCLIHLDGNSCGIAARPLDLLAMVTIQQKMFYVYLEWTLNI